VFDLFMQEDGTGRSPNGGLGIGLSLARTLIEQHGGSLVAASEGRGRGSTFTITLPLDESTAERPQAASTAAPTQEPVSSRVLVIDDNRDSADTMVQVLRLLGHDARGAYGAEHGLRTAESFRPRVVLLDLNMPDGDGFTVLRRLREQSTTPLYVAAMTGYGQASDRRRTFEAGFQAHLTKPVNVERLQELLLHAGAQAGDR